MVASDVNTFITSPILWVKLGLVVLLVVNGVVLERTETKLRRNGVSDGPVPDLWGRLRASAVASITLWMATLIAGTVLTSAA
jgi:cation transporter-like permease